MSAGAHMDSPGPKEKYIQGYFFQPEGRKNEER